MSITTLEKRLMLDASLGAIVSSLVFAESTVNAAPQVLDSDVSVSGTTTDFNGEDLTISTDAGAEDQLSIVNEGTGAGQIGFDGTNVTYEGTLIGTLSSNGTNGADLTIGLNASATKAAIERLIENINYQNTSDTPTQDRTITIALGALFSEDIDITVVAQNDDPVAVTNTGVTAVEGGSVTITLADLNVTDVDDADSDIVFTVGTIPNNGQLELTSNTGIAITSFTRDDLVNNRVIYVHDDSQTTSDSFDFTVTDGDTILASDTFNLTITSVNDPLSLDTNAGVTVFQNLSTTIGGEGVQFGSELLRYGSSGTFSSWNAIVDDKSHQYSLVFTAPASNPNGVPGEVLFESGGSGVGVGLFLNSDMELDFYSSTARNIPRLSSDALIAGQQYAVVVEIDQATDEIRMHYAQESNFNWFTFGRTAEKTLSGYNLTDHSGTDSTGIGQLGGGVYGGFNGTASGTTTFQGTIDSDVVITEFPTLSATPNTMLVSSDIDTSNSNLIYTITTDVANGTIFKSGVALGINDTFTQADLDLGVISYTNSGGTADSFGFSVTDGDTVIAGQTFTITIDTSNVAPEILTTTTILDEDFSGGTSGWNNNTTSTDTTLGEFWGRFANNVNVSGNQELYQTFATSGTQDYIVVEFDFYEFDTWDNEYFYVFVNDQNILGSNHRFQMNTFDNESDGTNGDVTYTIQNTTEALGYIAYQATRYDQTYHYTLVIENSDPTLKLGFGSSLNSNTNDESFGLDNLKITEAKKTGTDEQEFYIAEDVANNDTVGQLLAIDDNTGQPLTYSVTGGTGSGIFNIDATTGEIKVSDNSTLDFETTTSYTLDVLVTDGALSDTQTITINVLDVMENSRPEIPNTTLSISEDAAVNDDVGFVVATDADGDNITYSIVGGNPGNAFKIDSTTGLVEVRTAGVLDFDTDNRYDLSIRAQDDNDLSRFHDRNIRIDILDVDEAPSLNIEEVIESQNLGIIYSSDTGNFYKVITDNKNYDQALAFAPTELLNGVAGHLVTITSTAEYNFIRDFASPSHVRIALSDAGEEGKWIWTAGPDKGTQITQGNTDAVGLFNNWNGSEPNSGPTRNSALMHANGWWYDNWTGGYDSVVEWEGSDIINNSFYNVNHSNPDASDVSNGDSVGFIQGADPEGDTLDFTIQGGNTDGIFEIDTATGEIRILDTTNLDATVNDTYVLTIRGTENSGTKFDEIDITIKFNDDYSISANNTLNVNEDSSAVITTAELNISDIDNVATETRFFVSTLPTHGQLEHTDNPGFQISSFTLDDIQNGRISYAHGGAEITSDSFVFQVSDKEGGTLTTGITFNINIVNVNDAPTISVNTGATVVEGARVDITDAMLDSNDLDDTPAGLTYTVSSLNGGHIEVSGVMQSTFTQDDIDNNRVEFVHDGSEPATASFAFSLADSGADGALPATGTFSLNVTPVNDSPLITTNTGTSVDEGSQVVVTTAMLNVTDPDDSGAGLLYTLSNIVNGQVELSTNVGAPIINFTQADLNAGRVVFVHDGNENNSSFDVSVIDGGENSSVADTATFNVTRIPVNDSPLIGVNAGTSVNQNSIVVLKNSVLAANDPDDSGTGLIYTITGTTNGQLEFLATPNVAITTFTQDDIDNSRIVFRHSGPPGVADFDFTLADGGEDSSMAATGTFNFTVDNTNDSPTITTNTGPTVAEGSTTVITTIMLDSFDPDDFGTGLDWTVSNLNNGIVQVGGVTQNTFTQADLDNGIVTFIHDGGETSTAGFDVQVADGGEDSSVPATATFVMGISPVNDGATLVVNDGSPNDIDFNGYTINPYDNFQDGQGGDPTTFSVNGAGDTLTLGGNAWKKINIPYTLTANTVLSFEFFSDDIGEIFGIGFDNDSDFNNGLFGYQLSGTQVWSGMDQSFRTYEQGDGWVRFDIPIGDDFTGVMDSLVFVLDDDATPTGEISFRNVNFYEDGSALEVDEGATFNITNAHINSIDPDDSGTGLTFTASNLENGHIEVDGVIQNTFTQDDIDNNDVVFVHDGSDSLNAGFDISLADGLENGAVADTETFTLVVNPLNDSAVIATNTGGAMNEGGSLNITTAMLNEGDPDDDGLNVTYNISNLQNGHIEVSGVTRTNFTQNDIDLGRVAFIHDGGETTNASFDISLVDGLENSAVADTGTFNITVTPQNDGSVVSANTGGIVNEGAGVTITSTMLNSTDPDDTPAGRTYTASGLLNGHIEVDGVIQNTFTQNDINNNDVVFIHNGTETTSARFNFSLADGLEHGAVSDTGVFNLSVTPINDAATIATNTGGTMDEGASLTITSVMLNAADPDDSGTGLTYTASNLQNGHIEVSSVIQTTFTQDDINNNRVVFVHDDSETTSASFDISLADGLEHSAVADTGTFNIVVTPVNEAPVLATNTGGTIFEGGFTVLSNTRLSGTDVDNADSSLIYRISALPAGVVENTNTSSVLSVNDTFTQDDIDQGYIRYTHDGHESTSETLSFTLSDGALTLASMDFTWSVTPVNDVPSDLGLTAMSVEENSNIGTWIGNVYATDVDLPGDTFTFSIMADPDNKFMLAGNQLLVNGALDFETSATHSVMLRVDDGNGGILDRMMTINVTDFNENPFVAPGESGPVGGAGASTILEEDDTLERLSGTGSFIQAAFSGDESASLKAFYGEGGLGQILQEKTTFEIRKMTGDNLIKIDLPDPVQESGEFENNDEFDNELNNGQAFTNMRQVLEILEQFDDEKKSDETDEGEDATEIADINEEYHNLYDQFEDVLTYHEQRKAKLREALQ